MKPLNDNVFLRQRLRQEKASPSSGLYVPETVRAKSNEGEVVAVGPGAWDHGVRNPIPLQKDDRVLFMRFGYEVLVDGEMLFCVVERDILAKLDDDEQADFTGKAIDADERAALLGAPGA